MVKALATVYLQKQILNDDDVPCKLCLYSNYVETSKLIIEVLNKEECNELFRLSQFGCMILAAKNFSVSCELLWYLIQRQTTLHEKDEMWMILNKRPVRFSITEYCLLTGFNCSGVFPEVVSNTSFIKRHFGDRNIIRYEDVKDKFRAMADRKITDVNIERIKMACVMFALFVLAPAKTISKDVPVDMSILEMVEDFENFNRYPWGTYAYKHAIHSLKRDLSMFNVTTTQKNMEGDKCNSLSLTGFVHPLQVLIYEHTNGLSGDFALPQDHGPNCTLPRMCCWATRDWDVDSRPKMEKIISLMRKTKIKNGILRPSTEVAQLPYYASHMQTSEATDPTIDEVIGYLNKGIDVWCTDRQRKSSPQIVQKPDTSTRFLPSLEKTQNNSDKKNGTFSKRHIGCKETSHIVPDKIEKDKQLDTHHEQYVLKLSNIEQELNTYRDSINRLEHKVQQTFRDINRTIDELIHTKGNNKRCNDEHIASEDQIKDTSPQMKNSKRQRP